MFSQLVKNDVFFLSLATYKNDLFMSKNPSKILEFYTSFNNVQEIITWLKERPRGRAEIFEVDGDNDVIVVIPTADHNNEHSIRCKNEIFHGMRIIFVESANFGDPYFSFSHNCNIGIKKALEYNPKYIVWTNDDMLKIDDSKKLHFEVLNILDKNPKAVFAKMNHQVSTPVRIIKFNLLGKLLLKIIKHSKLYKSITNNKTKYIPFVGVSNLRSKIIERYLKLSLYTKFKTSFFLSHSNFAITSVLFKGVYDFNNFDAFGILQADYIRNQGEVFDENLIVQHADQDLSLRYGLRSDEISWIDYSIEGIGRATIKDNADERLRNIIADIYIDYKISVNQYKDLNILL